MAKRVREAALKRARERARQEKQEAKRERKLALAEGEDEGLDTVDEDALMEEFAKLSARYESDEISTVEYQKERERIFTSLGLESPPG